MITDEALKEYGKQDHESGNYFVMTGEGINPGDDIGATEAVVTL
jgi:hypothetical protein